MMKRKISQFLMLALAVVSVGVLGSCKDYDEDKTFEQLQATEALKKQVDEMKSQIVNITNLINQSNCACATWTPGTDGFWYKDGVKTDIPCKGADGLNGTNGTDGTNGTNADKWTIGEDGYWYCNDVKTEYKAIGTDGTNGTNGTDGETPTIFIDEDGFWVVNGVNTGVKAKGEDGVNGTDGTNGTDGVDGKDADVWTIGDVEEDGRQYWYKNGEKTPYIAVGKDGSDASGLTPDQEQLIEWVKLLRTRMQETAAVLELANELDLVNQIQLNKEAIDTINARLDKIEEALKKQVSGILVQGTYNPVYGTFALPTNIQSNVLMAYIGKTTEDISFPTTMTGNYVYAGQALTANEADMIGGVMDSYTKKGGKDLISSAEDNAGILYLTVNPNTVDFTGATLKLENSQGKSAGVTLLPLAKSDKTLTFGYTRAADNAFYEAKAHIDANDLANVQKLNLDKSRFEETVKHLVKGRSLDFTEIATAIYDEMNGVLDANAVVGSWNDEFGEHSVYSQYNVAATAVKPLSYAFAKDFSGKETLPGYERLESFIDRIANKAQSVINNRWPDLASLVGDLNLHVNSVTTNDIKFSFRVQTDGVNTRAYKTTEGALEYLVVESKVPNGAHDNGGSPELDYGWQQIMKMALNDDDATVDASGADVTVDGVVCNTQWDLTIKFNMNEQINQVITEINGSLENVDDFLADVNDLLDQVNNYESSVTSHIPGLASRLKNLLEKINNKAIAYIDAAIARLQPCMLIATSDGTKMGINSVVSGYVHDTEVTLIPTSYNAELITPAFKKHVACVDVVIGENSAQGGNAALKKELDEVNSQAHMNEVIEGDWLSLDVNLKRGRAYQFAYSALDYSGKICTKRIWVRVMNN